MALERDILQDAVDKGAADPQESVARNFTGLPVTFAQRYKIDPSLLAGIASANDDTNLTWSQLADLVERDQQRWLEDNTRWY